MLRKFLFSSTCLTVAALAAVPALAQSTTDADAAAAAEEGDAIVVTGIRGSLGRAIDAKRNATGVQETVAAEDIADFPDQNIGAALQRLTGVTVTRGGEATTDVGRSEGGGVRLRGLRPEFTQTTIDGLLLVSPSAGRETDFSLFPSELFASVDVKKTGSADQTEGGLSGSVDLHVARPLNQAGFRGAATIKGEFQPHLSGIRPEGSALVSWSNPDRTFGIVLAGSASNYIQRTDLSQGFQFNTVTTDASGTRALMPLLPRQGVWIFDRNRLGLAGAVQWAPNDGLEVMVTTLYAKVDEDNDVFNLGGQIGSTAPAGSVFTVENGLAVRGTVPNVLQTTETSRTRTESDLFAINGSVDFDVTETFNVRARVGYSQAERNRPLIENYQYRRNATFVYDLAAEGQSQYVTFSSPDFRYDDLSAFELNRVRFNSDITTDDELTFQADGRIELGGFVSALKFGGQTRTRNKDFLAKAYGGDAVAVFGRASLTAVGELLPYNGVLPHGPDSIARRYAVVDIDQANSAFGSLIGQQTTNLLSQYELREKVTAAYGMADLDFDLGSVTVTGDIGGRWVKTNQRSIGNQLVAGRAESITVNRSYDDFLPSANLRFELSDGLIMRLGASKTITRPTPAQIAPQQNITNIALRLATVGNPDLDPYRATNFDASLEYYFGREGLVSIAFFHKDVKSFVINTTTVQPLTGDNLIDNGVNVSGQNFTVTRPVNGQGAKVKGIEVSYQQPLTFLPAPFDGLGVVLNATWADSKATSIVGGGPVTTLLPGLAKWSYNAIAYYEKNDISLKLAYSWRDDYFEGFAVGTQQSKIASAGYLDFSARYNLTDWAAVTFEAQNLTSQGAYAYVDDPSRNRLYFAASPVYRVGARFSF